ncbi:hypothetical protein L3i22_085530 [Actinoplanes sp. L3-i22]|nr:hypothetical protein L3i22_085530 [Actinoplanes sp. L3-i22]
MWPMFVADFELAQRVQQVPLVRDQGTAEQLVAGPHPTFHVSVHARHVDAAERDRDPGVGEDSVEQSRVLAAPFAN